MMLHPHIPEVSIVNEKRRIRRTRETKNSNSKNLFEFLSRYKHDHFMNKNINVIGASFVDDNKR